MRRASRERWTISAGPLLPVTSSIQSAFKAFEPTDVGSPTAPIGFVRWCRWRAKHADG